MILYRNSGASLAGLTTNPLSGSISSVGGKIVMAAQPGNFGKNFAVYSTEYVPGGTPGMTLEFDWEINDLGAGNGFSPNQVSIITHSPTLSGGGTIPIWNNGLGFWLDYSTFPTTFGALRDASHNPNVYSSITIVANTQYHLKQTIQAGGVHALSVDADQFTVALGPASAIQYSEDRSTALATANNDFNNTTNPLTIVGAVTSYPGTDPFGDPLFKLNNYIRIHSEEMKVTAIVGNDVTLQRGTRGTTVATHANASDIRYVAMLRWFIINQLGGGTVKIQNIAWTDNGTLTPPAPATLAASAVSTTQINLTWSDTTVTAVNADYISIERSLTTGSGFAEIGQAAIGAQAYSDSTGSAGTTYYYRVAAVVTYKTLLYPSTYSSEANATTNNPPSSGAGAASLSVRLMRTQLSRRNSNG